MTKTEATGYFDPLVVSHNSLHWLPELLRAKNLSLPADLLERVAVSGEDTPLTKSNFTDILTYLRPHLRNDEWVTLGSNNWRIRKPLLNAHFFTLLEFYQLACSDQGLLATTYGIQLEQVSTADNSICILINEFIQDKAHPLTLLLTGELIGLPASIGSSAAQVSLHPMETGLRFDVNFREPWRPGARVRRWLQQALSPPASTNLESALQTLQQSHQSLVEQQTLMETVQQQKESQLDMLQTLTDTLPEMWWVTDNENQVVEASERLLDFTHASLPVSQDKLFTETSAELLRRMCAGDGTTKLELEMLNIDSARTWVEVNIVRQPLGDHLIVARDISHHKQFEAELQERQDTYQAITASNRDGMITLSKSGHILFCNPAVQQLTGHRLSALLGADIHILLPDLEVQAMFAGQKAFSLELKGNHIHQHPLVLDISFVPHTVRNKPVVTCIMRDVTQRIILEEERHELEQQLLVSQKMESVGTLAGGIAHDFNNLLVAIMGYAELAQQQTNNEKLILYLDEIHRAGHRAAGMTQKLLAFSRRQTMESDHSDLNDIIRGLEEMLHRLLPEDIQIAVDCCTESLQILADTGQLEQVLVNLVVNARDAMPDGGHLRLESRRAQPGEIQPANKEAQSYAVVEITDSGTGMSDAVRENIFQPFFTTKEEGAGTGLGLAVAYGIISQHDGEILVDSHPGAGSTFSLYLPLTAMPPKAASHRAQAITSGGEEYILVIEDDEQIRELTRLVLIAAGYQVSVADSGYQALRAIPQNNFDLVLMDIVMPGMGGRECAAKIWSQDPEIRILFTSGYPRTTIQANFTLKMDLPFIQKPYTPDQLKTAVRNLLDDTAQIRDAGFTS